MSPGAWLPLVLPTLNREAVRQAYLVARALDCRTNPMGVFERKNYFYPDLPKNYQISQFASPFAVEGAVELELRKRRKRVRIKEVHLEEDAGKLIHAGDLSLLDYNRAGTPLLEIVTQPDLEVGRRRSFSTALPAGALPGCVRQHGRGLLRDANVS
jgi:aspartyl-tRNA(Asn)/glutamyl-tRNA(Gln) amidotransferase subunit B